MIRDALTTRTARSAAIVSTANNSHDHRAQPATSHLSLADRWDHFLARWGVNRGGHRATPGLYTLGDPTPDSPVFVTANYTLSFDALRSSLTGVDGYLLVLDTRGVNVWCAAGKGTFGTDELVSRIESTRLADVVSHRKLILPQLGAPGVVAREVQQRSGFTVEYGPVKASDLPAYLATGEATPEMRRVTFNLLERVVLIPVELVHVILPAAIALLVLYFTAGRLVAATGLAAVLTGTVLFPVLLPWIPTRDFSSKGLLLGALAAAPFSAAAVQAHREASPWLGPTWAVGLLLAAAATTAFLALNFTGSTPLTSRSGVRREIQKYTRLMATMFVSGIIVVAVLSIVRAVGGS